MCPGFLIKRALYWLANSKTTITTYENIKHEKQQKQQPLLQLTLLIVNKKIILPN